MRIRLGESWKYDAEQAGDRRIVDVIHFEVDGVDIAQGLAETSLVQGLTALTTATIALDQVKHGREHVTLPGAPIELRLVREDSDLRLTIWSLETDSPLVRDVTVEWKTFREASNGALVALHRDLKKLEMEPESPASSLETLRLARRRRRSPSLAERRQVRTLALTPALKVRARLGPLSLGITNEMPTVVVLDPDDRILWSKPGAPLPTLVSLARACADASPLADMEVDRRLLTVRFGRLDPAPIAALREAIQHIADATPEWRDELTAALRVFPPPFKSGALAETDVSLPKDRRARAPSLPRTGLRRLSLISAWGASVPSRNPRLAAFRGDVLLMTEGSTQLLGPRGEERWRTDWGDAFPITTSLGGFIVGRNSRGDLGFLDSATGEVTLRAEAAFHRAPQRAFPLADGSIALVDPRRLVVLHPTGVRAPWSYENPSGTSINAVRGWTGVIVGTGRGELIALDGDGGVVWQTDSELVTIDDLAVHEQRGLLAVTGSGPSGRATLALFNLRDGTPLHRTVFQGDNPSSPVFGTTRVSTVYGTPDGSVVSTHLISDGRLVWRHLIPNEANAAPVWLGDDLGVLRPAGSLSVFSPSGKLRWEFRVPENDPDLEPIHVHPLITSSRLLVTVGACVHVLDPMTGHRVAHIDPARFAPTSVCLLDGPILVAASDDGTIEAWRSRGHLSVVS